MGQMSGQTRSPALPHGGRGVVGDLVVCKLCGWAGGGGVTVWG